MRRARAQGREANDRTREGGGEAEKPKKPQKNYRRHVENGGDLGGVIKNVDERGLAQKMPTEAI